MGNRPIKIYIAGKITGLSYEEYAPKFEKAARSVLEMGHIPLNPVELTAHLKDDAEWEDYILIGLEAILRAGDDSAVLMLHDWEDSRGAMIEHSLALSLDRIIIYESKRGDEVLRIWTTKESREIFRDKREPEPIPSIYLRPTGIKGRLPDDAVPPMEFFFKPDEDGSIQQP